MSGRHGKLRGALAAPHAPDMSHPYRLWASLCPQNFSCAAKLGRKTVSAVHKQRHARGKWRKAWVEGAFRTLSLDGLFARLLGSCGESILAESQRMVAAKPKQEENQGDRDASAALQGNGVTWGVRSRGISCSATTRQCLGSLWAPISRDHPSCKQK